MTVVGEVAMEMADMGLVRLWADCWLLRAITRPLFLWVRWIVLRLLSFMRRGTLAYQHLGTTSPIFSFSLVFEENEYRSHEIPPVRTK